MFSSVGSSTGGVIRSFCAGGSTTFEFGLDDPDATGRRVAEEEELGPVGRTTLGRELA